MNFFQRLFGHLRTIHRHRKIVRKLCFECGLYWQGLTHDLSKYSPVEFWNGVKFYTGTCSPHVGERKLYGYSKAWLHHKSHNKHHAEYWHDIQPNGTTEPIEMPLNYFVEMVCDRVAASKIYLKDRYSSDAPLEYYNTHKEENQFHPRTRLLLELYLQWMSKYGEDLTFIALKNTLYSLKKGDIEPK